MDRFNYRLIAKLTGTILGMLATAALVPLAVSLVLRDGAQYAFAMTVGFMAIGALLFRNLLGRKARYQMHEHESFYVTAAIWIIAPLTATLPFLLSGTLPTFTDAAFESFSGFTTTGSSVVSDPQQCAPSILLWRAITQWMGGLGLVLFLVAITRRLREGSLQLYDAEFSGTQQRKLHPKIAVSVSRMWHIYSLLTLILAALLASTGNSLLDSVCLAMSTVSTGGFMTTAGGLVGYSRTTLAILTIFMFLSGVNVALLYNFVTLHWRRLRHSAEFVVYLVVFATSVGLCTLGGTLHGMPVSEALRDSTFHVASTVSTCGFYQPTELCTSPLGASVTFLLILCGAMAGSTGGGIKLRRLMTLTRYLYNYFTRMLHPTAVFAVKIDHKPVPPEYVNKIFGFMFLYICFILGGAFLLTFGGSSISEAFCLAAANISNLGPSPLINSLGASLDYATMPVLSKWTLITLMLAGRLEIFALLAVFIPVYWKRR